MHGQGSPGPCMRPWASMSLPAPDLGHHGVTLAGKAIGWGALPARGCQGRGPLLKGRPLRPGPCDRSEWNMKKAPQSLVNEAFGSKEKLVEAVQQLATPELWLDRVSSEKGLRRVPNSKLLRLHAILSDAKARFGSRQKLIDAILELEKRTKDAGYRTRLERYPLPRLLDLHRVADRRVQRAKAKAEKPERKVAVKAAPKAAKKGSRSVRPRA